VKVPDIGDFKDVPVIEILVAAGQSGRKDASILTLRLP
jgi:dihydrolipoamide dehydrogenase